MPYFNIIDGGKLSKLKYYDRRHNNLKVGSICSASGTPTGAYKHSSKNSKNLNNSRTDNNKNYTTEHQTDIGSGRERRRRDDQPPPYSSIEEPLNVTLTTAEDDSSEETRRPPHYYRGRVAPSCCETHAGRTLPFETVPSPSNPLEINPGERLMARISSQNWALALSKDAPTQAPIEQCSHLRSGLYRSEKVILKYSSSDRDVL